MKKIIMYHYIRTYSNEFPFFNFLHINDFKKQINLFKKKNLLKISENFQNFITSENKILLSFDDGIKDHYLIFKELLKHKIKGIFFISTYPIINKDFLDAHKIHLILGKFNLDQIIKAFDNFKIKINFKKINSENKKYQLDSTNNEDEKKKIKIKIFLNFNLKNDNNKIIKLLFDYFFSKKEQKELFKNFYLTKKQIKEMQDKGMLIGGHSNTHKLLGNLTNKDQKLEIEKNIQFLSKVIKEKINFFAYPYGGNLSFNKDTIKILNNNDVKFTFNTGNKYIRSKDINHNIPRINCNKFKFGQIYKNSSYD